MCRPTSRPPPPPRRKHSLLLTAESFNFDDRGKKDGGGGCGGTDGTDKGGGGGGGCGRFDGPGPTLPSTLMTTAAVVLILLCIELALAAALTRFQDFHPLLTDDTNRRILARHVGVDAVSCVAVAYLGYANRRVMSDLFASTTMAEGGYERRLFSYSPASQHVLLFFFAYQVKNLFDSLAWGDGVLYVLHHVLAGAAAWGGMHPGVCHFYAIFYMGISEVSTAVLCLLANFDDHHGVVGLGDAFPLTKAALGVTFAVLFLIFRAGVWPYVTYHFLRDARNALALGGDSERMAGRRGWIRLIMYSCVGLSVLQVVFLAQIVAVGREEIAKLL